MLMHHCLDVLAFVSVNNLIYYHYYHPVLPYLRGYTLKVSHEKSDAC